MANKNISLVDPKNLTYEEVEAAENADITKSNEFYDNAIKDYNAAIDSMIEQNDAATKEAIANQNAMTDFTIEKIEQQKEQAAKDYAKEQSAAYTDYQKQINPYGVNAEALAERGMSDTGYAESSKVGMYNAYQNRVAVARELFKRADLDYDNGIKEAKLLNSSAIAKLNADAMAKKLSLMIDAMTNQQTLTMQKAAAESEIKKSYIDVYDEITAQSPKEEIKPEFRGDDKSYEINKSTGVLTNESLVAGNKDRANQVSTEYYKGKANPDARNGTFSNGYQPDNINGQKLSKTGLTTTVSTETLNGQKKTVKQNIWQTPDGRMWCWNGRLNKYEEAVSTPYYIGARNPDAQNGTFANGYQPDNVNGEKLYKTGDKIMIDTETLDGEPRSVNQNIWSTKDGRRYLWDGRLNQYKLVGKGDNLFQENARDARATEREKEKNNDIPGFKSVLDDLSKLFK